MCLQSHHRLSADRHLHLQSRLSASGLCQRSYPCSASYSQQQLCPLRSQPSQRNFHFTISILLTIPLMFLPYRTQHHDTRFCSPFSIFPELLKGMYPHNHLLSHQPWPAPERQLAGRGGIQHRHADHSQRGTGTAGDRAGQGLTVKEKLPARRPGSFTVNKNRDQSDLQLSRFQGSVYRPFHPVQEDRPATLLLSKPNDECFL